MGKPEDLAKAQAGALSNRFGGEEWLEGAFLDLVRHAAAGVRHRKLQILAWADIADFVGGHGYVACFNRQRSRPLHGVPRVYGQIEDGVFELVRIDEYGPGVTIQLRDDLNPLSECPVQQLGHTSHELPAIDSFRQQRLRP